jgi:hypothetical protein
MREKRNACGILVGKPDRNRLKLYLGGRIILEWISEKQDG